MMTCRVQYASQFHEQLMELSDEQYARIEHAVDIIADNPGLLREYDPPYDASYPREPVKWYYVPKSHKVIYLSFDSDADCLKMLFLGDTREDPMHRFDSMVNGI